MDKPTDEMVRRYRYNGPRSLDECCQDIKYGRDMVDENIMEVSLHGLFQKELKIK